MKEQINDTSISTFWYYVGLILAQFDGLKDGYAVAASQDQV